MGVLYEDAEKGQTVQTDSMRRPLVSCIAINSSPLAAGRRPSCTCQAAVRGGRRTMWAATGAWLRRERAAVQGYFLGHRTLVAMDAAVGYAVPSNAGQKRDPWKTGVIRITRAPRRSGGSRFYLEDSQGTGINASTQPYATN